jgi:hypothetical protein
MLAAFVHRHDALSGHASLLMSLQVLQLIGVCGSLCCHAHARWPLLSPLSLLLLLLLPLPPLLQVHHLLPDAAAAIAIRLPWINVVGPLH